MSDKHPTKGSTPRWRRRRGIAGLLVGGVTTTLAAVVSVAPVTGASEAATDRYRYHPGAPDTVVAQWDGIGSQAFTAAAVPGSGLGPPEGHVIFTYAGIAVYDAVMAIRRTYEPFAIRTKAPRGSSAEAAVAAAAHRIYEHYLPTQEATILDPAYDAFLLGIPEGEAKADGVAVGLRVANALLALRADDGFGDVVPYTPPNPPIPGVWIPTAAPPVLPIGTDLPLMQPFALESADQFRPDGPPALDSHRWAREYNEVKKIGSRTSTTRTAEQTTAARFWGEAPVQQAHGALRGVIAQHTLDIEQAARMMAMVSVAFGDSTIACFDAKYTYKFWRPITAITAGDTDPNPATEADPTWLPLLPATPNHPEYPSAHSCITPAGGAALAEFLGTHRIELDIPSLTGLGTRHYDTVRDLAREVGEARIWGGIHFRSAIKDGIRIAEKTADEVLDGNFEPTRRWKHKW